jgi:hypothetical protein
LESQKLYADGRDEEDAMKKIKSTTGAGHGLGGGMVRRLSRRGVYNSITFTDEELIPSFLREPGPLPVLPDNVSYVL